MVRGAGFELEAFPYPIKPGTLYPVKIRALVQNDAFGEVVAAWPSFVAIKAPNPSPSKSWQGIHPPGPCCAWIQNVGTQSGAATDRRNGCARPPAPVAARQMRRACLKRILEQEGHTRSSALPFRRRMICMGRFRPAC